MFIQKFEKENARYFVPTVRYFTMGKMQTTTDLLEHGGSHVFQTLAVANVAPKLTYCPQTPLFRL